MEVRNCRECRRLFNYITGPSLCPACKEALEKKFQEAKAFINENKGSTISMVAKAIDVSEQQVKQWVREERLVFTNASLAGIVCENCGTPILTGRYCEKCKAQTMNEMNSMLKRPEEPKVIRKDTKDNPRMRFLDTI